MKILIFLRYIIKYAIGIFFICWAVYLSYVNLLNPNKGIDYLGFFQYKYSKPSMLELYYVGTDYHGNEKILAPLSAKIFYIDDTGRYIYYVGIVGFGVIDYWSKPNKIWICANPEFLNDTGNLPYGCDDYMAISIPRLKKNYGNNDNIVFLKNIKDFPKKHKEYFIDHKSDILRETYTEFYESRYSLEEYIESLDRLDGRDLDVPNREEIRKSYKRDWEIAKTWQNKLVQWNEERLFELIEEEK